MLITLGGVVGVDGRSRVGEKLEDLKASMERGTQVDSMNLIILRSLAHEKEIRVPAAKFRASKS
jgi:hypothetical protein